MPEQRVRVTVVSLASQIWGSEVSVLGLAPLLAPHGIDVTVAAPSGDFLDAARRAGLRTALLSLPMHRGVTAGAAVSMSRVVAPAARETLLVATGAARVARLCHTADVVHCNSLLANLDCAVAGRLTRTPTVLEIHDLVGPGISRKLLSASVRMATSAVAISRPVRSTVDAKSRARVFLVPQAVDTNRFRPGPANEQRRSRLSACPREPIVAMFTRIDPEKGVDRVITAVADLNRAGIACSLAVVGESSDRHGAHGTRMRELGRSLLGERVRFLGRQSDVGGWLPSVDVVVNASDSEPFGLSVLEAQASGIPVVCGKSGGIADFVTHGVTGLLFDPEDRADLTNQLRVLLASPALACELADAAVQQTLRRHTLPARASAMAHIYRAASGRMKRLDVL